MQLRYKIWLENKGKAFGEGPYDILQRIDRLNSLSQAAKEINMSYSQAWNLINTLEKRLGFKLLRREVGGSLGGGSYLTAEARELMHKYGEFIKEADEALNKLYKKYFG
ncbi:LysR family transcriptional regulator [Desulfallas sp. Bu1-1]|uniref:winged helix-turn-helix domain-containing protein n=1 Tax=Desulfallas sp. Bu1-1 TaxID=2787620 RepID=UPI00189E60DF|nr:LysR family transcriptional regulator [Desulfallas sp. Bu1-1]MBF7084716.1 LysR family transcriptional regulator [Desulfallas sp. Bu1-1]